MISAHGLSFEVCGHGPPLLMVHGFGATAFTWSKIVPHLSQDHRVVTVDLIGFGASVKPMGADYSLHAQAAALSALVDELDLRDLAIVGHSMGGGVSLMLALELLANGNRGPRRLVLIDSICFPQPVPLFIKLLATPVVGDAMTASFPATWQVRYVLTQAYHDAAKIEDAFVDAYAAPLRSRAGRHALTETARQIIPADIDAWTRRYHALRVPVLLVWGRHDRIVPLSVGERLRDAVPFPRFLCVDDCGHVPQEEQPAETAAAVGDFLRG